MYAIHHCRHCGDKHFKGKISFKKRSPEYIYEYSKNYIQNQVIGNDPFYAEEIARKILVKTHEVRQAFHRLNREGLITQRRNVPPHDSRRFYGDNGDSSWVASRYYKR